MFKEKCLAFVSCYSTDCCLYSSSWFPFTLPETRRATSDDSPRRNSEIRVKYRETHNRDGVSERSFRPESAALIANLSRRTNVFQVRVRFSVYFRYRGEGLRALPFRAVCSQSGEKARGTTQTFDLKRAQTRGLARGEFAFQPKYFFKLLFRQRALLLGQSGRDLVSSASPVLARPETWVKIAQKIKTTQRDTGSHPVVSSPYSSVAETSVQVTFPPSG